ncbi:hypothetical protein LINPERHAP2_LOCUS33849, partial [Linum perenne]
SASIIQIQNPITKVKYKPKFISKSKLKANRYKISPTRNSQQNQTWSTPGPSLQESPPRQQHTDTRHSRKLLIFTPSL